MAVRMLRLKLPPLLFLFFCLIINVQSQLFLIARRQCVTPNGEQSFCTGIFKCPVLSRIRFTSNRQQREFFKQSKCSVFTVCCGNFDNYINTQQSAASPVQIVKTPLPGRSVCGHQATSKRIYGGYKTAIDEFPWTVLVKYRTTDGSKYFSCGGSLISKRYVITAAHCVTGKQIYGASLIEVRLGEWNTASKLDCSDKTQEYCADPTLNIPVEDVIPYPYYDDDSKDCHHDIAIIRLAKNVKFTHFINPICLPMPNEKATPGKKVTVAGWGASEKYKKSPVKLKVDLPVVENSRCAAQYDKLNITIHGNQLCAGGKSQKGSCLGDSGNPLMNTAKNDRTQWYLEGVLSHGYKCGKVGWPGVYTRVTPYLDWIYRNIKS